ncbi:MAG: tRNA pseudouridine(55) synthase TruB [Leptospirillum sp.]|jgi:tRNA pseudouridine55 synthase
MKTMNAKDPQQLHPAAPTFSGILLVDKPQGMTSHDVVAIIRKETGISRVGHGGTLDPMATGLLPILLGSSTKLAEQLQGWDKSYRFDVVFGISTDTGDAEGTVVSSITLPSTLTQELLLEALNPFLGTIQQKPPMYSAIKRDGVPLYKLARKGIEVERESRAITLHSLDLEEFSLPKATIHVRCSKGTYIRTLAEDIGLSLGIPAHVSRLIRTGYGHFSLEQDGLPLSKIVSDIRSGDLPSILLPPESLFPDIPTVRILDQYLSGIQKGGSILGFQVYMLEGLFNFSETIRISDRRGKCLALGQSLVSSESFSIMPKGLPVAKVVKRVGV